MKTTLTQIQAFNAMTKFLDNFYHKNFSDDIGSLLGDISFLSDGCTADPAAWEDWMNIFNNDQPLTQLQAFKAMRKFLYDYCIRTSSKDIKKLLENIEISENNRKTDTWKTWISCTSKALEEPEGSRSFLILKKL